MFKRTCPRWIPVVLTALVLAASTSALRAQSQAPQDEFVPVSQLPAQDQLPAAPLLIGAYAFVWVVICGYVISLARRVSSVQRDVARLEVGRSEMARLLDEGTARAVDLAIRALGFRYVTVDLRGYRLGSLNEGLSLTPI